MQAIEIIDRINVSDLISVVYHKHSEDRKNPDNGKFRSFSQVTVCEIHTAKSGALQVKVEAPEGIRSFTSEAIVKRLEINGLRIIENYARV